MPCGEDMPRDPGRARRRRMLQQVGPLTAEVRDVPAPVATVVLMAGLGLGPWFWEPWLEAFSARNLRVVALELPGQGDDGANPSLDDCVSAVKAALATLSGPIVLVGHSFAGLVAQLVAVDQPLQALILVCPMTPRQVRIKPARRQVLSGIKLLPALAAGRPVHVSWEDYLDGGLADMEEGVARDFYTRIKAWPNRLCRDLVRPPEVDPLKVTGPTLIVLGRRDRLAPWDRVRVLGDLYEAVVWRYDDLGHMPPWEPAGLRMGRDIARYAVNPTRPQVIESEGFMPTEGVGHELRRARRGEAMKKRSAYGQKKSARDE